MLAFLRDYPPTDERFWPWILGLSVFYILASYLIELAWRRTVTFRIVRIFDSGVFASSTLLTWGVADDAVLKAIGDTKPFLLIAGLAGLTYAAHALMPK